VVKRTLPFLFACLLEVLFACSIEEARLLAHKKLVIASDFLYPKDEKYFASFAKDKHAKIEIVHMSADSIQYRLKKDAYNTPIDVVMVQSLLSLQALEQQAFQEMDAETKSQLTVLQSFQKNWLLIARDPFVISFLKDSLEKPKTYRDLSTDYLWTSPDFTSLEVLKAQVRFRFQHQKKNKKNQPGLKGWLRGLKDHRISYQEGSDSTASTQLLLLKYSAYLKNRPLAKSKNRKVLFPARLYFDYFAMAIVPQARDYALSKAFVVYWNENALDKSFLRHFGMTALPKEKKKQGFYIAPKEIFNLLSKESN